MIGSFRNFAKTKFAGILVFIMIIPFVFWGMGGMFSSGNTNNIAKINNNSISTEDFIDYVNKSGIPEKTIRENLEQNIIEEILSGLVSTTLLDLEIKDFDLTISEVTLLKKIKENKNFIDKSLENFLNIEIILEFFPNAKILHSFRNFNDAIISIYQKMMPDLSWSHTIDGIINYANNYKNIINYFRILFITF